MNIFPVVIKFLYVYGWIKINNMHRAGINAHLKSNKKDHSQRLKVKVMKT
jgi:hypothetical protein